MVKNKVCVIGAGIVGTSAALLALQTVHDIEVTVIADKFTPYTTGDGAAGFIKPYSLGETSEEKLKFWCEKSMQFFQDISLSPDASEYGIALLPAYDLSREVKELPSYLKYLIHWRLMTSKEFAFFPPRYKFGLFYISYYVECAKLLPKLLKKIVDLGGKLVKEKINSFEQLHGKYDVVINCTGVGAAALASDPAVTPVRGQVIRVQAPWIKFAVVDEEFHVLPNSNEIICGGTHQTGDWNLEVDPKDRQRIWQGCQELVPSLKNAVVLRDWVGLRPGRFEPRLEREKVKTEKGDIEVIHNYGHGGSGVTIAWGCAHDVVHILRDVLNGINFQRISSNL